MKYLFMFLAVITSLQFSSVAFARCESKNPCACLCKEKSRTECARCEIEDGQWPNPCPGHCVSNDLHTFQIVFPETPPFDRYSCELERIVQDQLACTHGEFETDPTTKGCSPWCDLNCTGLKRVIIIKSQGGRYEV